MAGSISRASRRSGNGAEIGNRDGQKIHRLARHRRRGNGRRRSRRNESRPSGEHQGVVGRRFISMARTPSICQEQRMRRPGHAPAGRSEASRHPARAAGRLRRVARLVRIEHGSRGLRAAPRIAGDPQEIAGRARLAGMGARRGRADRRPQARRAGLRATTRAAISACLTMRLASSGGECRDREGNRRAVDDRRGFLRAHRVGRARSRPAGQLPAPDRSCHGMRPRHPRSRGAHRRDRRGERDRRKRPPSLSLG